MYLTFTQKEIEAALDKAYEKAPRGKDGQFDLNDLAYELRLILNYRMWNATRLLSMYYERVGKGEDI